MSSGSFGRSAFMNTRTSPPLYWDSRLQCRGLAEIPAEADYPRARVGFRDLNQPLETAVEAAIVDIDDLIVDIQSGQ